MPKAARFPSRALVVALMVSVPQQGTTRTISGAFDEIARPFIQIDAIRELQDGRVIVLDRQEELVAVVDFGDGTVHPIGRKGSGPGEYRLPWQLFALPAGQTAVRDAGNNRSMLIGADATPGPIIDLAQASRFTPRIAGSRRPDPHTSDTLGGLYQRAAPVRIHRDGSTQLVDSIGIERLDYRTGRRDTVATMRDHLDQRRELEPNTAIVRRQPFPRIVPFRGSDQWTVSANGRVAVASQQPYRITYFDHRGRTDGPVLRYDPIQVSQNDRDAWFAAQQEPQPMFVLPGGGRSVQRVMQRPPLPRTPIDWPRFFPAFTNDALSFAPDGRLWIRRAVSTGAPAMYDVVDGRGSLSERVLLPKRTHILGFGARSTYVVRTDEDGFQYLRRYAY